jgi:hypothetical protein
MKFKPIPVHCGVFGTYPCAAIVEFSITVIVHKQHPELIHSIWKGIHNHFRNMIKGALTIPKLTGD